MRKNRGSRTRLTPRQVFALQNPVSWSAAKEPINLATGGEVGWGRTPIRENHKLSLTAPIGHDGDHGVIRLNQKAKHIIKILCGDVIVLERATSDLRSYVVVAKKIIVWERGTRRGDSVCLLVWGGVTGISLTAVSSSIFSMGGGGGIVGWWGSRVVGPQWGGAVGSRYSIHDLEIRSNLKDALSVKTSGDEFSTSWKSSLEFRSQDITPYTSILST